MDTVDRPKVTFTGEDGNIFNLIAIARRALKAAGKRTEADEILVAVKKAGSYQEALRIVGEYVEFE